MELHRMEEPSAAERAARRGPEEDLAAIAKAYDATVAAGEDSRPSSMRTAPSTSHA